MGKYPGVPDPLNYELGRRRLKTISDRLQDAYTLLSGDEWRELKSDDALGAAIREATTKAREGFAIAELARMRLSELMRGTDRTN